MTTKEEVYEGGFLNGIKDGKGYETVNGERKEVFYEEGVKKEDSNVKE